MKIVFSIIALIGLGAAAYYNQNKELLRLVVENENLATRLQAKPGAAGAVATQLSKEEKLEFLRLRGQVAKLRAEPSINESPDEFQKALEEEQKKLDFILRGREADSLAKEGRMFLDSLLSKMSRLPGWTNISSFGQLHGFAQMPDYSKLMLEHLFLHDGKIKLDSFEFVEANTSNGNFYIIREISPRQWPDGTYKRLYGIGGRATEATASSANFQEWEETELIARLNRVRK